MTTSDPPRPQAPRPSPSEGPTQRRPLTTLSLSCLVIANMIGVGVYTTSGFTIGSVGSPGLVVLLWVVAGAIALLGAACYGGLARQVTESGGEYLFLSRGVHPAAGFFAGWISLTAGFSGAIGLAAIAFAEHLPAGSPLSATTAMVGLIVLLTAVNLLGLRPAAGLQNFVVMVKLAALMVFVLWGASLLLMPAAEAGGAIGAAAGEAGESGEATAARPSDEAAAGFPWLACATSLMWISLSYAGYNAAVYIAGAARRGASSVPRAMLFGTVGVTLLYVALNAVFVYAVPAEQIAFKPEVALIVAEALGGSTAKELTRAVILVSLATSVLAMIQAGPHVYAQMARDLVLPKWLAGREETPRAGILLQSAIAIGLVIDGRFLTLLDYLTFLLSLSSAATILCLFLPAFRGRPGARPVWGWPLTPALFVVITLAIAAGAAKYRWEDNPEGVQTALWVLPAGALVYGVFRWWYRKEDAGLAKPG